MGYTTITKTFRRRVYMPKRYIPWLKLLVFTMLLLGLPLIASAQAPTVFLDGKQLSFDVPPTLDNGRTLVPLRGIFEALGVEVQWDGATQTVTATKGNTTIKLTVGGQAYKNGQPITLDVPAKIINGRTLVPLRFVSEALGSQVNWDDKTQTITITSQQPQINGLAAQVVRVIDGDTFEVNLNGKTEKVRLIGVDTPETVHPIIGEEPYGKEASNFTKSQLEGKQVKLELDVQERDQYGRILAYVWLNGKLFNEVLLREGYAQVATYPPNVKYVEKFTAAQKEAREAGRGLWGAEETEKQTSQQPAATTGKYVGSIKSDKYHLPTCEWAEKIKDENRIWFQSEEEAIKAGYKPCSVCNP